MKIFRIILGLPIILIGLGWFLYALWELGTALFTWSITPAIFAFVWLIVAVIFVGIGAKVLPKETKTPAKKA